MKARGRWPRGRQRRFLGGMLVLALLLLVVDCVAYPYGAGPGGRSGNQGQNGLWLRYTWYFGQHSAADTERLAQRLTDEQIAFAFCHVRGIQPDGTLKFHYPAPAAALVRQLHQSAPATKVSPGSTPATRREVGRSV